MAEVTGDERRIYRGTYEPIAVQTPEDRAFADRRTRGVEKTHFAAALGLTVNELTPAGERARANLEPAMAARVVSAAERIAATSASGVRVVAAWASIDAEVLVALGRTVVEVRRERSTWISHSVRAVPDAAPVRVEPTTPAVPRAVRNVVAPTNDVGRTVVTIDRTLLDAVIAEPVRTAASADPATMAELRGVIAQLVRAGMPVHDVAALPDAWNAFVARTADMVGAFEARMRVEPIGRLHLERLDVVPAGLTRGPLVSSVPLAPKETVTFSHREWAIRSEEFVKLVQDELEGISEQGVSEKTELTQATEAQARHATALSMSASASYFGVSGSVSYSATSEGAASRQDSRNQSIDVTRKASSRARKEHKISFKIASTTGDERSEVRVITNPSETAAIRVDYHQLMRKWRVDLYRFGLRMTYDLVVPNPGGALFARMHELAALTQAIDVGFGFALPVSAVRTDSWAALAAQYGADVEPPPEPVKTVQAVKELPVKSRDEAELFDFETLEFQVDTDYVVASALFDAVYTRWSDQPEQPYFDVRLDNWAPSINAGETQSALENLIGRTGSLAVVFGWENIRTGAAQATLTLHPSPAAMEAWQVRTWNALRRAAQESHTIQQQRAQDQRARLLEEFEAADALALRQLEREEIMKAAVRWLFGPGFELVPGDIEAILDGASEPDPNAVGAANWQRMLERGELQKLLHQAIEWENVTFHLYPYFWDSRTHAELKRTLRHPDAQHRQFLRAGAARVVLAVRPGFEEIFAALVETGGLAPLDQDHPYVTIAREIQSYAAANYPGIPAAGPSVSADDVERIERGTLIGQWYEHMPTSALDISIDTPLRELV